MEIEQKNIGSKLKAIYYENPTGEGVRVLTSNIPGTGFTTLRIVMPDGSKVWRGETVWDAPRAVSLKKNKPAETLSIVETTQTSTETVTVFPNSFIAGLPVGMDVEPILSAEERTAFKAVVDLLETKNRSWEKFHGFMRDVLLRYRAQQFNNMRGQFFRINLYEPEEVLGKAVRGYSELEGSRASGTLSKDEQSLLQRWNKLSTALSEGSDRFHIWEHLKETLTKLEEEFWAASGSHNPYYQHNKMIVVPARAVPLEWRTSSYQSAYSGIYA